MRHDCIVTLAGSDVLYPNCILDGYDFLGNDLGVIGNINSVNECYEKCAQEDACAYLTYVKSELACYPKKNASSKRTYPGAKTVDMACINHFSK